MIIGLGDDDDGGGDCGCEGAGPCCARGGRGGERARAVRHVRALGHIGRAYRSGALEGLGDLSPGDIWPNPTEVDNEEASFDARVNAWAVDYQASYAKVPAALAQQVDQFLERWQSRPTFWIFSGTHLKQLFAAEAEWNKLRDQVEAYTHAPSSVKPATITVDGHEYRADELPPPPPGVIDHLETIVKWGAIGVAGFAAYKAASAFGLVSKVRRLAGGGST